MIALNVTLGQDVTKQRSSDWVGLAAKTENRHIRNHFSGLWIIAPIWGQFELMTTERSSCRWEGHLRDHGSKVFFGGEENYAKLPIEAIFTGNLFSYYLALGMLWDYNWITMSQQSLTGIELLMFLKNSTFKTNKVDCKWHLERQIKHCHRHNGPCIKLSDKNSINSQTSCQKLSLPAKHSTAFPTCFTYYHLSQTWGLLWLIR